MSEVTKITVNGREYDSVEQMPPEVRGEYLRALSALREAGVKEISGVVNQSVTSDSVVRESIVYNGRTYQSRDELPPEARALLEQMPPPPPHAGKTTQIGIKTVKTFPPEVRVIENWTDEPDQVSESNSSLAWLLVKILAVVVVILLGLLFWLGARFKG